MSEFDQDVSAESSTATEVADPSQATTQPAQQNGNPQEQFVPYSRFQQVNGRMREYERAVQTLQTQVQKLTSERQQSGQPQPTQEEIAAREALHRLDPNLKNVGQYGEKLGELEGAVQEFRQEKFTTRGDAMIASFAKEHGVDAAALTARIVDIIGSDPALLQRAQQGDVRIIQHFLRAYEPVVSHFKQQGAQTQRQQGVALAQNKNALRNGPPRSAVGTTPGAAAPEKFDPAKDTPQSYWEKAKARARAMTASLAAEEG